MASAVGTDTLDFGVQSTFAGVSGSSPVGISSPTVTWSHTVTASSSVLLVAIGTNNIAVLSVVWGTYSLRRLRTDIIAALRVETWFVDQATTGVGLVTVTLASNDDPACVSISLANTCGVDATAAITNNGTDPSDVVVTSRASDLVVDFAFIDQSSTGPGAEFTPGAGQTERQEVGNISVIPACVTSTKLGAATNTTMTQTDAHAGAHNCVHVAVSLLCAPAEEATKTVTTSGLSATSHIEAWFQHGDTTSDNGADEHEEAAAVCPLVCKYLSATTFEAKAMPLSAFGLGFFKFHWVWSD